MDRRSRDLVSLVRTATGAAGGASPGSAFLRGASAVPVLLRGAALWSAAADHAAERQERIAADFRDIDALRDRAAASVRTISCPQARVAALVRLVQDCGPLRAQAVRDAFGGSRATDDAR